MIRLLHGDCRDVLKTLPDASVHCCVTSPPYFGLRDYGNAAQIGLEPTPAEYVAQMVAVFREVRRVLRDDGTLWLNLGDSYAGSWGAQSRKQAGKHAPNVSALSANQVIAAQRKASGTGSIPAGSGLKPKDLIGIPWRVAFALQADGWWLRQDIIWSKPNPMPESVTDRCTKAHEYVFLMAKAERYFFDSAVIAEPCQSSGSDIRKMKEQLPRIGGKHKVLVDPLSMASSATNIGQKRSVGNGETRNKRSVWTIATQPYSEAHFATMAPELAETCVKAGCPAGGTVLDPFGGAGTTGLVADRLRRDAILIELNPTYVALATSRIQGDAPLFAEVAA